VKEDGRIIRDNVYGTIEEDALRRDFTINALFYDIKTFEILDYCHAMEDIANRQLRLIGDPVTRYKEDPVRMLRAIRLAVKLGLTIEPATAAPIKEMADLLHDMPGGRLWDESHKLFLAGFGEQTFHQLEQYGLVNTLLPSTQIALEEEQKCRLLIDAALASTDQRIRDDKPVNPAFLYACFLWWPVLRQKQAYLNDGYSPAESMQRAIAKIIAEQVQIISIPKRFTQFIREVWLLQYRLESRRGKNLADLMLHGRFRAAYDFLLLRTTTGEIAEDAANWWTEIQQVSDDERHTMLHTSKPNKGRRRRPRKRKPGN
jgi:poly(A) polymerase